MTARWSCLWLLAGAVVLTAPTTAAALRPQEVLVVVNANASGSEALGKYYCLSRNILEERMIVLHTTAAPIVGREEYDRNIRGPIRKFLLKNGLKDKIQCLALMWGVPVRVLGPELSAEKRELVAAHKEVMDRLHRRLAVDSRLLGLVGSTFPRPRGEGLRSVGELFDPGAAPDPGEYEKFDTLRGKLAAELKSKESEAAKIEDAAKRYIALRQCAAIRLDAFGPHDLAQHLPKDPVPGIPDKAELDREAKAPAAEGGPPAPEDETPDAIRDGAERMLKLKGLVAAYQHSDRRTKAIDTADEDASVDSELALLWEDGGKLRGARPNPMNWRLASMAAQPPDTPKGILMTARIDGPTAKDALRIIKDSLEAEKAGLEGKFYIDAGGKYPHYDVNLENLAKLIGRYTKIPLVLDTNRTLFAPGSCPDAALYVGWYGLQKYVPAFRWVPGSVGWHVASLEAVHLRVASSDEWCVKMIQNGVAATLGAVNEPYLGAFPLPQDFFSLLLTGRFTLAECYWRTVPTVSWRLTLIGDPLYNPFRLKPHLSIYVLPAKMVGRDEDEKR